MPTAADITESQSQGFDRTDAATEGQSDALTERVLILLNTPDERNPALWTDAGAPIDKRFNELALIPPPEITNELNQAMGRMWSTAKLQAEMELIIRPTLQAAHIAAQSTVDIAIGTSKAEIRKAATEGQANSRIAELREARRATDSDTNQG